MGVQIKDYKKKKEPSIKGRFRSHPGHLQCHKKLKTNLFFK